MDQQPFYSIDLPYAGKCDIIVSLDTYKMDHSTCLRLRDAQTGEPIATATICLVGSNLAPNEVCIKSFRENEEMAKELIRLGIIGPARRTHPADSHEYATIHELLI